jgi:hypothetical protein
MAKVYGYMLQCSLGSLLMLGASFVWFQWCLGVLNFFAHLLALVQVFVRSFIISLSHFLLSLFALRCANRNGGSFTFQVEVSNANVTVTVVPALVARLSEES